MLTTIQTLLLALVFLALQNRLLAEDAKDGAGTTPPATESAQDKAVASAFALPRGAILNDKQQAAFAALKLAQEPDLRKALDGVKQAEGDAAEATALKAVTECRAKIRAGIQEILAHPNQDATNVTPLDAAATTPNMYQNNPANYPYNSRYRYGYSNILPYYAPMNGMPLVTTTPATTTTAKPVITAKPIVTMTPPKPAPVKPLSIGKVITTSKPNSTNRP